MFETVFERLPRTTTANDMHFSFMLQAGIIVLKWLQEGCRGRGKAVYVFGKYKKCTVF